LGAGEKPLSSSWRAVATQTEVDPDTARAGQMLRFCV
jgi:hypothetical protein